MASLAGFADAKRSTPVASVQKAATTTPSPQRSSAPLAGFAPAAKPLTGFAGAKPLNGLAAGAKPASGAEERCGDGVVVAVFCAVATGALRLASAKPAREAMLLSLCRAGNAVIALAGDR